MKGDCPGSHPASHRFGVGLLVWFWTLVAIPGFADETPAGYPVSYRATEDIVYGHKDGLALTLDVLEPIQNPNGLGLILVSSGSWSSRKSDIPEEAQRRLDNDHWAQGLLKGGFTLFVVRHGSSPRYAVPEMIPDMNRSVRFVRAIARRFGTDPDHLGITSGSSGGHLALMAAMTADDGKLDAKDPIERISSRVQCVVAWFPPTDMINWGGPASYKMIEFARPGFFKRILGEVKEIEPQLKAISPIYLVTKEAPPLLLIHGDSDKTVPLQQSEIMKDKYEEMGLPVKLVVQPGGGHSSWPGVMDQYPTVWAWFNKYLKPQHVSHSYFDLKELAKTPNVFPSPNYQVEGVKGFFYQGLDYKGRPTRVFAYYGIPANPAGDPNQKYPAMVLIHGGGGTAFDRWVKLWNARGYAAIAMDLCGCVPDGEYGKWKRHEYGGPAGWGASFEQLNDPVEDQWTYHATSAVMLGHSLMRSFSEVDPNRIGVTGISWGGYLTCVVSGVDARFKFAAPVYGCGFLGSNSAWLPEFEKLGLDKAQLWLRQWDPSSGYLGRAQMPFLWVNGTNDFAYPMDSWQKSYRLPTGPRELCLRVRMPHGHGPAGENPEEILIFANSILRNGAPLARITDQGQSNDEAWATFTSKVPITSAELNFTADTGKWQERKWETLPATIDQAAGRVVGRVPADAKVFYINLIDDRNCVVSTEHVER